MKYLIKILTTWKYSCTYIRIQPQVSKIYNKTHKNQKINIKTLKNLPTFNRLNQIHIQKISDNVNVSIYIQENIQDFSK